MKGLFIIAVCAAVTLTASPASAQASCGGVDKQNDIFQENNLMAVGVNASTSRDIVLCPLEVQVEAWVVGIGGAGTNRATYNASIYLGRSVPTPGTYQSKGKHWLIWWGGASWDYMGDTQDSTDVVSPPGGGSGDCNGGGGEGELENPCGPDSPIIIDTKRDGYHLTNADEGVYFDLDADGIAERVAWTRAGSDDAFLALDRNGNGRIDDGSELFGNRTPAYWNQRNPPADNGFVALVFTEGPSYGPARADGVIDRQDAVYQRLLLWRDLNHNGVSEPKELELVSGSGLMGLSTDYKENRRRDPYGNEFRQRAVIFWQHGNSVITHHAYDVWLRKQTSTAASPSESRSASGSR